MTNIDTPCPPPPPPPPPQTGRDVQVKHGLLDLHLAVSEWMPATLSSVPGQGWVWSHSISACRTGSSDVGCIIQVFIYDWLFTPVLVVVAVEYDILITGMNVCVWVSVCVFVCMCMSACVRACMCVCVGGGGEVPPFNAPYSLNPGIGQQMCVVSAVWTPDLWSGSVSDS